MTWSIFFLPLCLSVDFGSGVTYSHRPPSAVECHREQSWRGITVLRAIFIFIIRPCSRMALGREHHGGKSLWRLRSQSCNEKYEVKYWRQDEGNQNSKLNSFSRPLKRLIDSCWSNFGSYKNSPFVLKSNDVPHGADGFFFSFESPKRLNRLSAPPP